MVREEDVILMSRIAMYEQRDGKKEIPMHCFYKGDFVRLNTLKALVSSSITFVLIVAVVVYYKSDELFANLYKMDYKTIGLRIVTVYAIWLLIYWVFARVIYSKFYEKSRPNIIEYNHRLKNLLEKRQKEEVKAKGGFVIDDDFINF